MNKNRVVYGIFELEMRTVTHELSVYFFFARNRRIQNCGEPISNVFHSNIIVTYIAV